MDSDNDGGHSHALGHAIGIGVLVGLIAFAFGRRTAQGFVGTVLIVGLLAFLYVAFRIVTDTI